MVGGWTRARVGGDGVAVEPRESRTRARRRTAKVLDVGRRIFASAHRRREYWVTLEGGEDLEVRDGGGEDALGGVGVARRQGVFGDVERAARDTRPEAPTRGKRRLEDYFERV